MTELRADFAVAAAEVSKNIETLQEELFGKVRRYDREIPEKHEGKEYRKAVLTFTRQVNRLEKRYQTQTKNLAEQISALHGKGWESNPTVLRLWHDYAEMLTAFSEHPSKKVATVIVDEDNRLQAYGVNKMPPGITKRAEHFIRGLRSKFIICSERMALIDFYNQSVTQWWSPRRYMREQINELERKEIRNLSKRVGEIGEHSLKLRNSTMITTTTPCEECAEVIVKHWPKNLVTNGNAGGHFTRSTGFDAAETMIRSRGIHMVKMESIGLN